MKDYIIFLKSGDALKGKIADDVAAQLKETFINPPNGNRIIAFNDSDGEAIVRRNDISAIGINNIVADKTIKGFR